MIVHDSPSSPDRQYLTNQYPPPLTRGSCRLQAHLCHLSSQAHSVTQVRVWCLDAHWPVFVGGRVRRTWGYPNLYQEGLPEVLLQPSVILIPVLQCIEGLDCVSDWKVDRRYTLRSISIALIRFIVNVRTIAVNCTMCTRLLPIALDLLAPTFVTGSGHAPSFPHCRWCLCCLARFQWAIRH